MKLLRLKLNSKFRGLPKGFELNFRQNNYSSTDEYEPVCFVGLNGSGKSNTLEVLCEIFYYLELRTILTEKELTRLEEKYDDINFEIEYKVSSLKFFQAANKSQIPNFHLFNEDAVVVRCNKKRGSKIELIISGEFKSNKRVHSLRLDSAALEYLLPNKVIAYSSGQNELISNPFIKLDFHYFDQFRLSVGKKNVESNTDINRMFFMDYESNELVLLANYLFLGSDLRVWKERSSLNQKLELEQLYAFNIQIKFKDYKNDLIELPSEINLGIDDLKKCASIWFDNQKELKEKEQYKRVVELHFYSDGAVRKAFRNVFKTPFKLFRLLYLLRLMNIHCYNSTVRTTIKDAPRQTNLSDLLPRPVANDLVFKINNIQFKKSNSDIIRYKQLSDGEHQLLHVMGIQWLMQESDVLFILDEPETHFNPEWRSKLVDMIVSEDTNFGNFQDHIITSHSPYIVSDCKPNNVYIFKRENGKLTVLTAHDKRINTFGTSVNILTDEIFGKSESQGDYSLAKLNEIKNRSYNSLEDIQKAKEDAKELGDSVEKALLFRKLFILEDEQKNNK